MNRHKLIALLFWLIALALLVWSLRQLPMVDMFNRVGQIARGDLLAWIVVNITILYVAVRRWQLLAVTVHAPLSLTSLFRLRQAGSTVSFLTPGPQFGGEPLQLYWLHRDFNLALHRAIAVLGLERFMETTTNFAVLLAGIIVLLASAVGPAGEWLEAALLLALALVALFVAAALIISHPDWLANRLQQLAERWKNAAQTDHGPGDQGDNQGYLALIELLRQVVSGERVRLGLALLVSLAGWALLLVELAILLRGLGLSPSVHDIVLIMVAMRLAMLLPVPGGLGTIEGSLVWSFGLIGLPLSAAGGLIALIRLRDALMLVVGFGCMSSFRQKS